jgi:hypothetical protein
VISSTKVRINIEIPNKTGIYIKKLIVILIEGKKEEVSKRLKQRFEYDNSFIDRIMSADPTGYKYIDYIAKQLEKLIPELAGEKGGLNIRQQDAIEQKLSSIIPWFHNNFNRITENDIWEAEPIYRNQHGVVPNIENIAKSPKDINQYENPEFIVTLMDVIDSKKSEREKERELKAQVEKLYEDDDVLVVRPKSFIASCYYGANTKWCTTTKGGSSYFDKYTKTGLLYYFIKKKENKKYALYRNVEDRKIEAYNAEDREVALDTLREEFPNQVELIDDLIGVGDFIKILKQFSRGKIDSHDLKYSDDAILDVKTTDPLGQSIIVIDFDTDEKFFKTLDISEDDQWFLSAINSYYDSYEFMDSYTIEDDFKSGYTIYYELNQENLNLLKKISELILPGEEFNLEDEEYRVNLSATLLDLFEDEMDYILGEYMYAKNSEMLTTARESIEKEINGFLESIGFSFVRGYDQISTTVANLIMWSVYLNLPKIDLISLFNQIIEHNGTGRLGGWNESSYEYQDNDNFDSKSFNNYVESKFEQILENLDESSETNPINEFLEFRTRVVTKFPLKKWMDLPKNKRINFRVKGFDREDMKVLVELQHPSQGFRTVKLSEENFNHLLYQPELFKFGELY